MKLRDADRLLVVPALSLLPEKMRSQEARVMLLTIGLQESRLEYRHQIGGPAHGYLQFERLGVEGVLTHSATDDYAHDFCKALDFTPRTDEVYDAIEYSGLLAMGVGRLLLWTDPYALPSVHDAQGAWDLYIRCWRPGRPHRNTWNALHDRVLSHVLQ